MNYKRNESIAKNILIWALYPFFILALIFVTMKELLYGTLLKNYYEDSEKIMEEVLAEKIKVVLEGKGFQQFKGLEKSSYSKKYIHLHRLRKDKGYDAISLAVFGDSSKAPVLKLEAVKVPSEGYIPRRSNKKNKTPIKAPAVDAIVWKLANHPGRREFYSLQPKKQDYFGKT